MNRNRYKLSNRLGYGPGEKLGLNFGTDLGVDLILDLNTDMDTFWATNLGDIKLFGISIMGIEDLESVFTLPPPENS